MRLLWMVVTRASFARIIQQIFYAEREAVDYNGAFVHPSFVWACCLCCERMCGTDGSRQKKAVREL